MIHHNPPPGYFGKVDRVPGICYVITRFWLFGLIPLIPLGTYLVRDLPGKRGNKMRLLWAQPWLLEESGNLIGRIPMSLKSVLLAWLRFGCVVGASIKGFLLLNPAMAYLHEYRVPTEDALAVRSLAMDDILSSLPVAAVCAALLLLSYRAGRPSPSRVAELRRLLLTDLTALSENTSRL
jgi:hypothetical protein